MAQDQVTIYRPAGSRLAAAILLPLIMCFALPFRYYKEGSFENLLLYIVAEKGEFGLAMVWFAAIVCTPSALIYWMIPAIMIWKRGYVYSVGPDAIVATGKRRFDLRRIDRFEHRNFPRKQLIIFLTDGTKAKIESFLLTRESRQLEQELRDAAVSLDSRGESGW